MTSTASLPEQALYYLAEKNQSLEQLARHIYQQPSPQTLAYFKQLNSHITNNRVLSGEMVIVTPYHPQACYQWEYALLEHAKVHNQMVAQLHQQEREVLAKYYNLIQDASSNVGMMYGWTGNYFMQRKRHVQNNLKKIQALYTQTLQQYGDLHKNPQFFSRRQQLFLQIDNGLRGMLRRQLFGSQSQYLKVKNQLGLHSKAIVGQWKQGGAGNIKAFTAHTQKMLKVTKQIKAVGYAAIALDIGHSAANIHEACTAKPGLLVDDQHCEQTSFEQTGRATGSILGGTVAGGALSYGLCNLILGLPTGGTSLLWCTIVAGGAGGYAGSQTVGKFGSWGGKKIYETSINFR